MLREWQHWQVAALVKRRKELLAEHHSNGRERGRALSCEGGSSIACWGRDKYGQAPPESVVEGRFVAVSAGHHDSLALCEDGSIACWGYNGYGQAPPDGLEGPFVALSAGTAHSVAFREDGSVACCGRNDNGQAPPDGLEGPFVAVSAGWNHSLALHKDNNSIA